MTARSAARRRAPLRGAAAPGVPAALLVPALALAGLVLMAAPAAAHTELAGSAPAAGATVPADTAEVVLSFTGQVRPGLSTVVVRGPDGAVGTAGPTTVRGTDVVQPLAVPLAAGAWTVAYRVVAADGHPVTGTLPLTVTAAGAAAPPHIPPAAATIPPATATIPPADPATAQPGTAGGPDQSAAPVPADVDEGVSPVLPALGGVALAAGAGLLLLRRRSDRG